MLIFSIFFFPISALAVLNYTRTPEGEEITSPVSFEVSFDELSDIECEETEHLFWGVGVVSENSYPNPVVLECVSTSTFSHTFEYSLEEGDYYLVGAYCGVDEESCENLEQLPSYDLEGDEGNPDTIFEVVKTALFEFPSDFLSTATDYLASTLDAVKIPLALVFGISLMMWIVNWIVGFVSRRARKK